MEYITNLKTKEEIQIMRESGEILGYVLAYLESIIKPGMTPLEIDEIATKEIIKRGGEPGFYGYEGFPNTCCISVNEEVVHTIPSNRPLLDTDILTIDCGVRYKELNTDSAITILLPNAPEPKRRISKVVKEALKRGIKQARHGNRVGDISHAIESYVRKHGFNCVKELTGHGIGYGLHEQPYIPNIGRPKTGEILEENMTICIEPIITEGRPTIKTLNDEWTIVTKDGKTAAQEEHTILITKGEAEILSKRPIL